MFVEFECEMGKIAANVEAISCFITNRCNKKTTSIFFAGDSTDEVVVNEPYEQVKAKIMGDEYGRANI